MIGRLLWILAALSVIAAGVTGWLWWDSTHDSRADLAAERDSVLATGERQVADLNTVDYRNLDAVFTRWQAAATGPLLERLVRNRETDRQSALTAKTVATARVVTAAVTAIDGSTANVIAAVEISVEGAAKKVSRLDVDLVKGDQGWQVSALEVVGT
ncbi:MAG: hypothetical protein ABW215_16955 [Kibdelosporangium sp.]